MNVLVLLVPSAADVADIKVGDLALDAFGRWSRVTEISYRGVDVKGRPYVGFYVERGPNSQMSGSYKAGELVRTVAASHSYTSASLDEIERKMLASGERLRKERTVSCAAL